MDVTRKVLVFAVVLIATSIIAASAPVDARARKARAATSSSGYSPAYIRGGSQGDGPPWPQLNHD
jgi:hypothetical protein